LFSFGASQRRILSRHVLPNIQSPVYASSKLSSASGAYLITDFMPLLQLARRLYIWLVPITRLFLAFNTK
jgi:hypothetical protein